MSAAEALARRNLHLKGLQRIHPEVLEIIDDIPHVALYRYSAEAGWTRMEIEGSAYLTRNSQSPLYSFIIMNKKGTDDLLLHILQGVERVRLQESYLMLKCSPEGGGQILGVWIHDDDQRRRAKDAIDRILKSAAPSGQSDDLLQKLSNLKTSAALTSPAPVPTPTPAPATAVLEPSKSLQLLSLLKKPSETSATKPPLPSQPSGEKPAATLKALLSTPSPTTANNNPTNPNNNNNNTSSAITSHPNPSNNSHSKPPLPFPPSAPSKNDQLLALLNKKPSSQSPGELLTDGEIARATRNNGHQTSATNPSNPTPPNPHPNPLPAPQPMRSRGNSGAELLALLSDSPAPQKPKPVAQPVKKPFLISPSDLED